MLLGLAAIAVVIFAFLIWKKAQGFDPLTSLLQYLQQLLQAAQNAAANVMSGGGLTAGPIPLVGGSGLDSIFNPNDSSFSGGADIQTGTYLSGLNSGVDQTNVENANNGY